MGAWGTGNWQNDEALDWAAEREMCLESEAARFVVQRGKTNLEFTAK
jgi:hypothetical protein